MPEPKVLELAWAAGFFDGEGCVRFRKEKTKKENKSRLYGNFVIQVCQVNREPLDRFLAAVGAGKIYGPYKYKSRNHQPYYQYAVFGDDGLGVFRKLRPYLCSIKREEGDFALALLVEQRVLPRLGNGQLGRKRGPYKVGAAQHAGA